jgi:biotin-dependent carboxylase-like uncharacterized protein
MTEDAIAVIQPGLGLTVQDRRRIGWRKFGVPPSGPMDAHASAWANRLLDNPPDAPVLELLLQGARLLVLQDAWVAVTGADASATIPGWRVVRLRKGEEIYFPENRSGVWIYLAVEGGFTAPAPLGCVSTYARAGLGTIGVAGSRWRRRVVRPFSLPDGVASRSVPALERRDYARPPVLRVWPGPQWRSFPEAAVAAFFDRAWAISSRSDRLGYRLSGEGLPEVPPHLVSEPVRVGTVQVPADGLPIVTMWDGPTVGGYPKFGLVHPEDLPWLAQCRPGQLVRFRPLDETGSEL